MGTAGDGDVPDSVLPRAGGADLVDGVEPKERFSDRAFRALVEHAPDFVVVLDQAGAIRYVSPSIKQTGGYEPEELLGRTYTELVHPSDLPTSIKDFSDLIRYPDKIVRNTLRYLHRDGSWRMIETVSSNCLDKCEVQGIIVNTRDVTQRVQGEKDLAVANRALRTLSACSRELAHATTEAELMCAICRVIVEKGGYRLAWVGYAEQDASRTVRPVAQFGYEEGYLEAAQITWADTERGRGPTGTAIRTGEIQVNQNFLTNPRMAPWRAGALQRGYQSSISLPLANASGTFGALTLYAAEPDAFDSDESELLQRLAGDIVYGIQSLRTRAERDRAVRLHQEAAESLRHSLEQSIQAISDTIESRDPYTAGHQRRTGALAVAIARELNMTEEQVHGIRLAAGVHDLGKLCVPAEILAKPGKLTSMEFSLIKNHVQVGYDILKNVKFPWPIATVVLQHHEKLDGSGYPLGLKAPDILLESRIMTVADIVEAMASHRPYRPALGIDAALAEIHAGRERLYDAAVADACLRLFRETSFKLPD